MKAFVLVQTAVNSHPIANYLRMLPGIETADDVKGPYDAIALVASDVTGGVDRVLAEIRRLPGVTRALVAPLTDALMPSFAGGTEAA
jgi:hypothetical protein